MTKAVKVGNCIIGGGAPVTVQSMANVKTERVSEVVEQIHQLEVAGCDIIRVSVQDERDAKAVGEIVKQIKIPLVADVHFDHKLAIMAVNNGASKIRINPGNVGSDERVREIATALKSNGASCRVGSNSGSIEKDFLNKYGVSEIALAESALKRANILEKCGFSDIVLSAKASSVPLTVKTYRYLSERCDYPLHVGVTEAGTLTSGLIKGSAGIGALLLNGIGDTIRYSLSASPIEEVRAANKLLRSLGLKEEGVEVIACPTCGRTEYDCIALAQKIEDLTAHVKTPLKIAVMGCIVNGPGEARECDIGIAGNGKRCVIFKKGEIILNVDANEAVKAFIQQINKMI